MILRIPRFSNAATERQFLESQNARLAASDQQIYVTFAFLFGGSIWLLLWTRGASAALFQGLLGALVWLLPLVLYRRSPTLYVRQRSWWVAAFRLGLLLLLPSLSRRLEQVPPREQLYTSPASLASLVAVAAQLTRTWGLALGLRLDLRSHLSLHVLLAAELAAWHGSAHAFCRVPFVNNPESLRVFQSVSQQLTNWTSLLLPSLDWAPPASGPGSEGEPPALYHCYALVVATHLVLGLFLSSVAVYITERRSRAEFLVVAAAARGVDVVRAGEELGLPAEEVVQACVFDSLAEWARCLTLLLPLAAATWLAALMAAARWLPEEPLGVPPGAAA